MKKIIAFILATVMLMATLTACGSTDLKKIDALDRAISVSFLGLASGKIGKSFKCNHCGYMW